MLIINKKFIWLIGLNVFLIYFKNPAHERIHTGER